MTLYFGFGANTSTEKMANRCPQATLQGTAVLQDYRFFINTEGVATVIPTAGKQVYGLVWELTPEDEKKLDKIEGVHEQVYRKEYLPVWFNGQEQTMLTYVSNNTAAGSPKPGYLEDIITAAQKHNFPAEYIEELRSWLMT